MGLKKKKKEPQNADIERLMNETITGNPHGTNAGLANQLNKISLSPNDPLGSLILQKSLKLAEITIYHVENNVALDTNINKYIKQSNELIRIANLSYYHQSKNEFTLCSKELRLLKSC